LKFEYNGVNSVFEDETQKLFKYTGEKSSDDSLNLYQGVYDYNGLTVVSLENEIKQMTVYDCWLEYDENGVPISGNLSNLTDGYYLFAFNSNGSFTRFDASDFRSLDNLKEGDHMCYHCENLT
jgi:hypothetical protein